VTDSFGRHIFFLRGLGKALQSLGVGQPPAELQVNRDLFFGRNAFPGRSFCLEFRVFLG
jgi:hypothetical protein